MPENPDAPLRAQSSAASPDVAPPELPVLGRIRARAAELGFDALAVARADVALDVEHDRYRDFLAAGRHGDMGYLATNVEVRRRLDGESILAGARSVLCLARRYARGAAAEASDPPLARRIARYARGCDYHGFLRKRLGSLAAFVRGLAPGVEARPLCDTAPVLERAWAARAGLGFVGKNGLVIVPGQGSFVLLGEVVTTLALPAGQPAAERCGTCRACLDACPTSAFAAPYLLDPRRCVAYLTIEARSAPAPGLRAELGADLFGCDACQSACPYNAVAPAPPARLEPFTPLARWSEVELAELVAADEPQFLRLTEGSPLRRATRAGLARAALLAAAHARPAATGGADASPEGPSDPAWGALLELAAAHDDPGVRELAAWLAGDECPG
ncbi:MAG: tRNA epoxyqueuosine(34) reductase QueG [Myxococcales bacterium]|nr:tRNA epoxyqueuosine(34) reductase QueG [Myxococcales bacterium]